MSESDNIAIEYTGEDTFYYNNPVPEKMMGLETPLIDPIDFAGGILSGGAKLLSFSVFSSLEKNVAVGEMKLLMRYSARYSANSIENGVALTMEQKGTHIFANKLHPKQYLNQLAEQMGGEENVIRAALQRANGRLPAIGRINDIPVNVGGMNLYIKGYINKGTPIINSLHNGALWKK